MSFVNVLPAYCVDLVKGEIKAKEKFRNPEFGIGGILEIEKARLAQNKHFFPELMYFQELPVQEFNDQSEKLSFLENHTSELITKLFNELGFRYPFEINGCLSTREYGTFGRYCGSVVPFIYNCTGGNLVITPMYGGEWECVAPTTSTKNI